MYIFLLILLGFILRLINIDKPEGLWNDEYVSWFVASTPLFKGFWQEVFKQCHMPIYYLYLKPFVGFNDLILRLTSLLPSMLSILVMYRIGKFYSKKTGYICAILTTISPFLIYYSQEVRFYSLLFFLSSVLLYYLLKIKNKNLGWRGYIITAIIIVFTHVLGIFYVLLCTCYLCYLKKIFSKKAILYTTLFTLIVLPFGVNILKMLPSSQWWGIFSYTNILFLFSDYLSPILTNNVNAPPSFFYNSNILFNIYLLIPTLIGVCAIINGIKKARGLFLIISANIILLILLALTGKIVFITKYSIEVLPILILLFALGIRDKIGYYCLIIYISMQLFAINTTFYPSKSLRTEGHNLVAEILNNIESDKVIFTYYEPNRFYRYLKKKNNLYHISKTNRFNYLSNPIKILDEVKKGEFVSLVFLDSVSFIPENYIEIAKAKNFPEMFITFSIIRNALEKEINAKYSDIKIYKNGSWLVLSAKKLK